ncbi:hypothetical protein PILCRDRAFT_815595 [Piloderma croceum F 1598]|uniref:Uncharacterized protein n=1 Tax=Piloderma croceum (strain F 1598) TaxID=765440 RepID=A0A0C3BL32_PILCF|nr:hypothetical protein PILCRDRAFT_815595 [Piloderma croceum F 1598]
MSTPPHRALMLNINELYPVSSMLTHIKFSRHLCHSFIRARVRCPWGSGRARPCLYKFRSP